jgi:P2-related tail formation protein
MFIIRFPIYFCLSFAILSIPISHRPLFSHLDRLISPYTARISKAIGREANHLGEEVKDIGTKLFATSAAKTDEVSQALSATRTEAISSGIKSAEHEEYTNEERELLERIMKGSEE